MFYPWVKCWMNIVYMAFIKNRILVKQKSNLCQPYPTVSPLICWCSQCSPYQEVTSKIYRLKQHFLPLATAWRFTKIKYVVLKICKFWSDLILSRKWMNIWKSTKAYQLFLFWPCILEREHWRQGKIIGSKRFKLLSKDDKGRFVWSRS